MTRLSRRITPTLRLAGAAGPDFAAIRTELGVAPTFPDAVLAEAAAAAGHPALPDRDATDIPFVTIDPPGSIDLDQAMHLAARDGGYRVSYAIANVAAFVRPGGALDDEAWARGETRYSPDLRTPLHPPVISEGAGSLLPDQVRPAVLWQIDLDSAGDITAIDVYRARVRSVAKLDYPSVQSTVDAGDPHPSLALLPEIGSRRLELARARHAIELDLPDQEVVSDGAGGWTLTLESALPVELWNAQISLLTGMAAARLMLGAGIGILRTLPPAGERDIAQLRQLATSLGVDWPAAVLPGDLLTTLDRTDPRHVAFLNEAAILLRGAGYSVIDGAAFDGAAAAQLGHAGVAAPYAHVTAPLRRLVDRFGSEVCLAVAAGVAVPDWARASMPRLPEAIAGSARRAGELQRAVLDATEAVLLSGRVGEVFEAIAVGTNTVLLTDPPVRARCAGPLPLGTTVAVRLVTADVPARTVAFEVVR